MIKKILQSKKSAALVATFFVELLIYFIPLGESEMMETRIRLMELIAILGGTYQFGQGIADHGKERAKIDREAEKADEPTS
jgi:hypothetical protein